MNMYEHIEVNRDGYLLTVLNREDGKRTYYACADRPALDALILRLTGRPVDTFAIDHTHGLPRHPSFSVAGGLHIYRSMV